MEFSISGPGILLRISTGIPFLGDIPIIGVLFKTVEDAKDDTELMIFITPRIVDAPILDSIQETL